ncbi:MAG TPA: response regulator [Candidatus Saccharimonadales bacterium]
MSKTITTVMVVEDEALLLQAATKKLEHEGIKVLSCPSGEAALKYVDNLAAAPDAIWLDYYLKDMNGLAFMQAIKTNPKWAEIPVIVVSNSASPDKVHNMLALGVNKYILKAQYRLDEIITILREIIDDARAGKDK